MSGVSFSGLLDSAKKVFEQPFQAAEKVGSAVAGGLRDVGHTIMSSPVLKTIAIAAAIYFTAGIAMAAFPETAGFAAAMPGVDSAAGAMGVTAATADTGAIAAGAGAAGTAAGTGAVADAGTGLAAGMSAGTGAEVGAGAETAAAGEGATAATAGTAAGAGAGAGVGAAGWSPLEKIAAAKVASDAIGGALAPSLNQQMNAEKQFRGSFFGVNPGGDGAPIVPKGGFNLIPQPNNTATGPSTPAAPTATPAPGAIPNLSGAAPSLAAAMPQPAAPATGTANPSFDLVPQEPQLPKTG